MCQANISSSIQRLIINTSIRQCSALAILNFCTDFSANRLFRFLTAVCLVNTHSLDISQRIVLRRNNAEHLFRALLGFLFTKFLSDFHDSYVQKKLRKEEGNGCYKKILYLAPGRYSSKKTDHTYSSLRCCLS